LAWIDDSTGDPSTRLERNLGGFLIADLADQDHVGIERKMARSPLAKVMLAAD